MAIPTTFSINHNCGHTADRDLSHVPAGKRKAYAFGLSKNQSCPDCFKKQSRDKFFAELDAQELAEAEAFEQEHSLPELDATEKQLPFATRVRHQTLRDLAEHVGEPAFTEEVLPAARQITRAGWWLSNREFDLEDMPELIATAVDDEEATDSENPF